MLNLTPFIVGVLAGALITALAHRARHKRHEAERGRMWAVGDQNGYYRGHGDGWSAAKAHTANHPEPNAWRDALHEALIINHSLTDDNENDPEQAINDLISIEQQMALDPTISAEARALRDAFPPGYDHTDYMRWVSAAYENLGLARQLARRLAKVDPEADLENLRKEAMKLGVMLVDENGDPT